jgi:ATP-dependent RNA helicase DeaD
MTFQDLQLREEILKAIQDLGFQQPTEIQQKAIPELISEGSSDFVGLAQTGTGKTAAFGLPMLHLMDTQDRKVQAVILSPTRELGIQIAAELKNFAKYLPGVQVCAVYGGASIEGQMREIKQGANIIVATPGRLLDILERGRIDLSQVKYLVLDEADEMLNMGFKDALDDILRHTPKEKRTWLFSATMPQEVRRIAKNYMTDPLEVVIGKQNSGNKNIEHQYVVVRQSDRYEALKRLLDYYPDIFGLIFCRTKIETQEVADKLIKDGYNAEALHGDLSQAQRDLVMKRFRQHSLQILVATDVAARGIDVNDISHVMHYMIPDDIEVYTHRSGRTGRAGKTGISIAILTPRDERRVREIENQIKQQMQRIQPPKGQDICEKQLLHLVARVAEKEASAGMDTFLPNAYEKLQDFTKEELIQKFLSFEFERFLNYYENAQDLSNSAEDSSRRREPRGADTGFTRFFLNIGALDGANKGSLLKFLCDTTGLRSNSVGRIDLMKGFSFFEVPEADCDTVLSSLKNSDFEGKRVSVEVSKPRKDEGGGGGGFRKSSGGGGSRYSGGGNSDRRDSGRRKRF